MIINPLAIVDAQLTFVPLERKALIGLQIIVKMLQMLLTMIATKRYWIRRK